MACRIGRRDFLRYGALATVGPAAAAQPRVRPSTRAAVEAVSLDALREAVRDGRQTARAVTDACLDRIDALDRQGPTLRAVIEVNPEAQAAADALDAARAGGQRVGPLHGMPILLKDNIDTADRMTTTAGSLALRGSIPAADAFVAERLREAGAVLVGKANLSEWANFRSTRSSSGWSARGGQCRNPYALDRNPCGSSSGSAAAVAASLVPASIGTETDGSIVCPASANGIVGIKPTVGLVSRAGIIPIAHSQDTAGPMARTVRDAAIVLGVLAGPDPARPRHRGQRDARPAATTRRTSTPTDWRGRASASRAASPDSTSSVDGLLADAVDAMRARGAEIVDPVSLSHTRAALARAEVEVLLHEFKADLNAYLAALGPDAPVHSLAEIIEFNRRHAEEEMPYFRQERLEAAEARGPLSEPAYLAARRAARRLSRDDGIDRVMDAHAAGRHRRSDRRAGLGHRPRQRRSLRRLELRLRRRRRLSRASPCRRGTPSACRSAVSFFGRAWSEPTLIRIAYAFEQATLHRRPPRYLPTAELGV